MLRKFVCAAVIVVIGLGVALGDEFQAVITKIDGNKVSFKKTKKGEAPGDEMTLPVSSTAKIAKGKFNQDTKKLEVGDTIENGLKNEMFSNIGDKGVNVRITTDADNKNITEIVVGGKGGKGKKKKDA
jgi:hypothetical protein